VTNRADALSDGRATLVWVQFAYMTRQPSRVREGFLAGERGLFEEEAKA
jgi:hypothetical protein